MNLTRPITVVLVGLFGALAASSCGGSSTAEQGKPGTDAGAGKAGNGTAGGESGSAGSGLPIGGSGHGGSGTAGGSSGSSGVPGSSGSSGANAGSGAISGAGGTAPLAGRGGQGGASGGTAGNTTMGGRVGDASVGGTDLGGAAGAVGGGAGAPALTPCGDACTNAGFSCCDDHCVNTMNDPFNCGSCGTTCSGGTPLCSSGACATPPCDSSGVCPAKGSGESRTCCGSECCWGTALCCEVPGPVQQEMKCYDPSASEGTCPRGCNSCKCAAPDTPIATPEGERAIATLRVGDLVLSVDHGAVVAVPVSAVHREPVVSRHSVTRVTLENGRILDISRGHPTADERTFGDLHAGDRLGAVTVTSVVRDVPYEHSFTYDILPDSTTGSYFAAGALIGSTLATPMCAP